MSAAEVVALIPTYQRPRLLARAAGSVLAQTWPGARVSIFDNASGDQTAAVAAELGRQGRVSYHRHAENLGSGGNFLYALAHVDAPFFSILSDDDLLLPRFYEEAMAAFTRHPEAGLVCLDVLWSNAGGDVRREPSMAACAEGLYGVPRGLVAMAHHVPTTWTGIVFRREVLDAIGTLDLEVGTACDVDFVLRAAAKFPFVLRHVPGAVFVPASIGDVPSLRASVDGLWPGWKRMTDRLAGDPALPVAVRAEVTDVLTRRSRHYVWLMGAAALVRGDPGQARRAASLLGGEMGRRGRARALALAAAGCEAVPGLQAAVRAAFSARQAVRHLAHRARGGARLDDLPGGVVA